MSGVKEYQKRHQLKTVDGTFNTETSTSLVDTVKHIQKRLWFLGYFIGNLGADGYLGPLTHEAIKKFQKDHELKEDGEVDIITWTRLVEMVKHIQFALKHLNHSCDVNGDTDEKTATATKSFQTAKSLKADGICGPLTVSEIMKTTKRIQRHLSGLGFDIGKAGVDGKFGLFTENATKEFQKEVGMESNGVFCQNTLGKMQEWVKKIQTELIKRKYSCGDVGADGVYGYLTQSAVKSFQKDNNLVVDGIAGKVTRSKLFSS